MRISDWSSDVCSSDLPEGQHHQQTPGGGPCEAVDQPADQRPAEHSAQQFGQHPVSEPVIGIGFGRLDPAPFRFCGFRSEEHTSELQSLMRISYAVFCLKKKKKTKTTYHMHSSPMTITHIEQTRLRA